MTGFGGKKGMGKLYIIISKIEKIIRLFGKYFNIETNKKRISSFFIEKNRKKLIFFCLCLASRNLPDWGGGARMKGQRQRKPGIKRICLSDWEVTATLEAQCAHEIHLNREMVITYSWTRNQIQLRSVGVVFVGEQSWTHNHLQGYYNGHFLYRLSIFACRPEEGFVIPVNLTWESICQYHGSDGLLLDIASSSLTHAHSRPHRFRASSAPGNFFSMTSFKNG